MKRGWVPPPWLHFIGEPWFLATPRPLLVAQEHGDCALYRHGLTPAQAATCTGPPAFQWSGDSMAAYAGLRLRAECRYRPGSLSCAGGAPLPRGRMLLVPGELPAQAKVVCTGLVCLLPSLDHVLPPPPGGGGKVRWYCYWQIFV